MTREFPSVTTQSGGIGSSLSVLAPALARRGHTVHVLTCGPGGPAEVERDRLRFHLLPPPTRVWPLEDVDWARKVARSLRMLGPFDVVYAAEWGGDASLYAVRKTAGPLVTKLATSLAQVLALSPQWRRSPPWLLRHALQGPLERRQAERSDALVAPSHAVLEWARELWRLDGVPGTVIPNAVEADRIRALAAGEPPPALPQGDPLVVFFGRLEIRKGVHVLVEAMRRVWDEVPDARLAMIGGDSFWGRGAMSEHLRELAGDRADRLHLLGGHPPELRFPAVAAATVVALPSLWEAFGIVVLEAMALGRAVVTADSGGQRELITAERDGLLVPPGDPGALAAAIVRLLGDPGLRDRLGRAAADRVEDFAPGAVAERFEGLFASVARQGE